MNLWSSFLCDADRLRNLVVSNGVCSLVVVPYFGIGEFYFVWYYSDLVRLRCHWLGTPTFHWFFTICKHSHCKSGVIPAGQCTVNWTQVARIGLRCVLSRLANSLLTTFNRHDLNRAFTGFGRFVYLCVRFCTYSELWIAIETS